MSPAGHDLPLWKHICCTIRALRCQLRQQALSVIVLTIIVMVLQIKGCFIGFETQALDNWLRWQPAREESRVVIVHIDNEDYDHLFNATSPLNPASIRRILDAIAMGKPEVIGVDLDTSSVRLKEEYQQLLPIPKWPPIVWARDAYLDEKTNQYFSAPILGGNTHTIPLHAGLAVVPQEADGIVRRYQYGVPVIKKEDITKTISYMHTFPWVLAQLYQGEYTVRDQPDERLIFNFLRDRFLIRRLTASQVLKLASSENWRRQEPWKGKIVLLGGSFRAARETYITPIGPMSGVELMARAVEAKLSGTGIRDVNFILMLVFDLVIAFTMTTVSVLFKTRPHWTFRANIVAVPILSFVGSWIAFSAWGYWTNYVPLVIGLWIHQLYHDNKVYRKLAQPPTPHHGD